MVYTPYDAFLRHINRIFGLMDKEFREIEQEFGLRNALPSVTIPAIRYIQQDYYQTYDDGEKVETYKNGKLHGEVQYRDGRPSEYFIEGRCVTKEKWDEYQKDLEENEKKYIVSIGNKEYKVSKKQLTEIQKTVKNILESQHISKIENK